MKKQGTRMATRGGWMVGVATALVVLTASPALADTSQSTAQAARLTLGGGTVLTTGEVRAFNNGSQPSPGTVTGNTTPALSILGDQDLLTAGVLVQQARANPDRTSSACAGVVGPGGLIQIGPAGDCTVAGAAPGGVVIDLGGLALIRADAILAQCHTDANNNVTGSATLVNAQVFLLGGPVPPLVPLLTLPANPAPNTGVDVGGLLTLQLNRQTFPAPGVIEVSALYASILNDTVVIDLGHVTCGPSLPIIPMIPLEGVPIALATLGAVGAAVFLVRRRRAASADAVA